MRLVTAVLRENTSSEQVAASEAIGSTHPKRVKVMATGVEGTSLR